jgi:modified peptide precursor CbpA
MLSPGGREFAGLAGKPPEEGGPNMAKESSCKKPISIRYTCAPNGDQVGLSHYLMADAKKAK